MSANSFAFACTVVQYIFLIGNKRGGEGKKKAPGRALTENDHLRNAL